ncbi:hypothetical protein PENTCL1PPCAC_7567 [Pristionchus entomophagus]|uniref:RING-type domain-containing protein n=1 Tax=Pristionchus entomophagus TaxID=358040 RepID=A0AAV5SPU3_9BILA|nr:hypothetical protein PENTCL1PPCAC_7567 [Pristionchus entomophagus]
MLDKVKKQLQEEKDKRERLELELHEMKQMEEERVRKLKEREDEWKERLEREKEEGRRKEMEKEKAEREERDAEIDVVERSERLARREKERSEEKIEEARLEAKKEKEIEKLRDYLRKEEEKLQKMREENENRDAGLVEERCELNQAKAWAAAKRDVRIQAIKEADDNPYAESLRYSRKCSVCLILNPRRRVTMVACGHMTCVTCAEELPQTSTGEVTCPFCRKSTTYVKTFEDLEETQEPQHSRKRESNENPEILVDCVVSAKRARTSLEADENDDDFMDMPSLEIGASEEVYSYSV